MGGFLLVVGLLTRLVAVQAVIFMAVGAFLVHWPIGWFWTGRGAELPVSWLILYLVILAHGGGKFSLDRKLGRQF